MKRKKTLQLLLLTALAVVCSLSSCGSDDDGGGGTPPVTPTKKSVAGTIEKGPFVQGSKVTLYALKDNLTQTGKSFKAQTTNHLGKFSIEGIELESQYVELETNGFFYNEVKGETSVAPITLNAISDVTARSSINVNIITHLEYDRVKNLVKGGSSFSNAKKQAEKELLKCFAITDEISTPEGVSITDNNRNASILLAISTIMLYDRSEGEFTAFLAKFMADFADNGMIDDLSVRNGIAEGQENAHPSEVIEKMKEYYGKQNVAINCEDFSKYIDFNGDGVIDDRDEEDVDQNDYSVITPAGYFTNEGAVRDALNAVYPSFIDFVDNQSAIEIARLYKGNASINPSDANDNTVYQTWEDAYSTIAKISTVINGLEIENRNEVWPNYYAEAIAMRSFVYYQLAVLWGNVPLVMGDEGMMSYPQQKSQQEVLEFAKNEVIKSLDWWQRYRNGSEEFNEDDTQLLLAELLLTTQEKATALNSLLSVDYGNIQMGWIGDYIYNREYLELLIDEAKGETESLVERWKNYSNQYGKWAALKRLGVAQSIASCSDYELLLPIPNRELMTNPYLRQNPGY